MCGGNKNPWNLEETREHIVRLYGRDQLELAGPCLQSVADRQAYARIHNQDAQGLLDAYVQSKLQNASLLHITLGGDEEAWTEFNVFLLKVGAHLIACIQSLHAMPDILAHAVYYALGLNRSPEPLTPRAICASSVTKRLLHEANVIQLQKVLSAITGGDEFTHLSALANHSKHRSIVFPALNEDWTGQRAERHAVMLTGFEYEGRRYPQVVAREFLIAEYERCSNLVVQAGNELNSVLRSRAP